LIEKEGDLQAKSIAIGQAGERRAYIASIISETGHANGQGGFGGVMGSKKLKAIIVRGTGGVRISVPFEKIQDEYRKQWRPLLTHEGSVIPGYGTWKADKPDYRWEGSPGNIIIGRVKEDEINRSGLRCNASLIMPTKKNHIKNDGCFGCLFNCYSYVRMNGLPDGVYPGGQMMCQQFGTYFPEHSWDFKKLSVSGRSLFLGKQLADMYTINAVELRNIRNLLIYLKNGHGKLTSKQREELADLPWESEKTDENGLPFIQELAGNLAKADYREENLWGVLSRGVIRAACSFGVYEDIYNGIDSKYGLIFPNNGMAAHFAPHASSVIALLWMMENKDPNRHDLSNVSDNERILNRTGKITEKLFGIKGITGPGETGNNIGYGKIFFTKWILIRGMLKNSLTLCDWVFPNYLSPIKERGYCGDLSLESKIYSAVTGHNVKMEELDKLAEGALHLQRALTVRDWQTKDMRGAEGYRGGMGDAGGDYRGHDNLSALYFKLPAKFSWAGRDYSFPPLDRQKYEEAKSMLYRDLGWDNNGAPTRETLEAFGLKEVADELDQSGLIGA
jgi:aldehyde:ferredoxin oxidoreductase